MREWLKKTKYKRRSSWYSFSSWSIFSSKRNRVQLLSLQKQESKSPHEISFVSVSVYIWIMSFQLAALLVSGVCKLRLTFIICRTVKIIHEQCKQLFWIPSRFICFYRIKFRIKSPYQNINIAKALTAKLALIR